MTAIYLDVECAVCECVCVRTRVCVCGQKGLQRLAQWKIFNFGRIRIVDIRR